MARSFFLILLAVATLAVSAAPAPAPAAAEAPKPKPECSKVGIRKEWRDLSLKERKAYIDAVVCLQNTPGVYKDIYGIEQLTAHEDYIYQHKYQSPYVHWNGIFLVWHRYFLHNYEKALKTQCGYTGMMPYWDQTLDRADSRKSPVYDPDTGFGGNGEPLRGPTPEPPTPELAAIRKLMSGMPETSPAEKAAPGDDLPSTTGGGCVTTGPFAKDKYVLRIARFNVPRRDDHCLERDFNPRITAQWSTPKRERDLYKLDKYADFHYLLEGMPDGRDVFSGMHGGGHGTYGSGNAGDPYASPGDPLFFMHHNNIDRIWRDWQKTDLKKRLYQMDYPWVPVTNVLRPDPDVLASISNATTVGLDFPVDLGELAPPRIVNDFMDTRAGFLCYDFA